MPHAEIDYDLGRIAVTSDWSEKELIKQVPGANWHSTNRMWHMPMSWGTCVVLRGIFGDKFTYGDSLRAWLQSMRACWIDPALQIRDLYEGIVDDPRLERLFNHQRIGVQFLGWTAHGALLADDMGTGKTPTIITANRNLNDPLPALVVCPNSVKRKVWAQHIADWFPEATPHVIGGGAVARRKQLAAAAADPSAVVIINYEAVRLHSRLAPYGSVRLECCVEHGGTKEKVSQCEVHPKELNEMGFHTVIFDEAHRLVAPKNKMTRACWALAHGPTVQYRFTLTGTPIANDVADLWSVMHTVAPLDFPSRTAFIDRYALMAFSRYATMDIVGIRPDTRDELFRILHPRMRRMLKANVAQFLPPKVYEPREAELTPAQRKLYREMENQLLAETEEGDLIIARTNLTKAVRLLQFSSASCTISEDDQVMLAEPSSKLDVLEEVLEDIGDRQVAVCAASRQLIELAAARLDKREKPITYRLLTGAVPEAIRAVNLAEFAAGNVQVMLFTLAAGGVGIDLTAADTIVFLQRSWSLIENLQAEDRVHRIGSERHESITIIDVIAPDTIEEKQVTRLRQKRARLEEIVQDRARLSAAGQATDELDAEEAAVLAESLL